MTVEYGKGTQSIYDQSGKVIVPGEWDPKAMLEIISRGQPTNYWSKKRVLDIGANTCGLSIEIARLGASVVALEPDPFNHILPRTRYALDVLKNEQLNLSIHRQDLFAAVDHGSFDIVLCLGLIYHFRYPQYILDFLSTIEMCELVISTQCHDADNFHLVNRKEILPESFLPPGTVLAGWHPSRKLFSHMMRWAGFDDVVELSPGVHFRNKAKNVTNSSYFRGRRVEAMDPEVQKRAYYPR